MRPLDYLWLGAIRQQHPYRNFQPPPSWIGDRHRAVSTLRPADDLKASTMERVEWIDDLDMRIFRARGIVGVDGIIPICIASSRVAGSRPISGVGFHADTSSFCPSKYSVLSFAESFSTLSNALLKNTSLLLPVNSLPFNPQQSSPLCYAPPRIATGSFMPSDP